MTTYRIGALDTSLAAAISVAMCVISFLVSPARPIPGQPGICLPSPGDWGLPHLVSWILACLLLAILAIGVWQLNRVYNFIRTPHPILPILFLIFTASIPWNVSGLSTSLLMCAVNIMALYVLFDCYDSRNATQQLFLVATFLSIGSMFQYAFIPMAAVYLIAAIVLKIFRVKELLAFLLGFIAPYWVGIGFGWLPLSDFRLPEPSPLFSDFSGGADLFILMLSIGTAVFMGIAFGIPASIRIYAGNSRVNAMNSVVAWMGIVSLLCVIIDFNNFIAYLATLYFVVAVEMSNFCALWPSRHDRLYLLMPSLPFILYFILFLI